MKLIFEFATQYGVFRDALYLEDDHTLTETQINELKQARLDKWILAVESQPDSIGE